MKRSVLRPALIAAALAWHVQAPAQPLPALDIDSAAVTVSGLSSGAFMAVQLHVAYSSVFSGAGVVAGGPFACASGTIWPRLATATTVCMDLEGDFIPFQGPPKPKASVDAVRRAAEQGGIDDPANLEDDRVYLFSGASDHVVPGVVLEATRDFYSEFVPAGAIRLDAGVDAGHGLATQDEGVQCDATGPPYLNDCDFDTAGEMLRHLYGDGLRAPGGASVVPSVFSQSQYTDGASLAAVSLAAEGYVYVPRACADGARCRLHVALHGCRQYAGAVGRAFVEGAGYNGWAEANGIVVLYPQAQPKSSWWPDRANPRGCWDWWGYTGADFYKRDAPQMRAIVNMVSRLAAGRPTN